jgi:hypothetical protein
MAEALLEPQAPTKSLDEIRQALVAAHGLEIIDQPLQLDAAQEAAVLEGFAGTLSEVAARAREDVDAKHVNRNVAVDAVNGRINSSPLGIVRALKPGESTSLMQPESDYMREQRAKSLIRSEVAVLARVHAVRLALTSLGINEADAATYFERARAAVYNSTANGAPLITERIVSTPQGDIHEMNLHGAGSPEVVDSEVVIVKK